MKRKSLDHAKLARDLGSEIRGHVEARGGYFGALELAEEVRRRFRQPVSGGRATLPAWTERRLLPVRPTTLKRLGQLADRVSALVKFRVEPLQVAAMLLERELAGTDDRVLTRAVAGRVQRVV